MTSAGPIGQGRAISTAPPGLRPVKERAGQKCEGPPWRAPATLNPLVATLKQVKLILINYLIRYLRGVVHIPQTPTQVTRPGCPQTRCSCVTSGSRGTQTCISRRLPSPRGPGPGRAAESKTCTFLATAPCPARSHTCRCPSSVYIFTLFCRKLMFLKQNLKEDAECWQCAWPGSVTPCCKLALGVSRAVLPPLLGVKAPKAGRVSSGTRRRKGTCRL